MACIVFCAVWWFTPTTSGTLISFADGRAGVGAVEAFVGAEVAGAVLVTGGDGAWTPHPERASTAAAVTMVRMRGPPSVGSTGRTSACRSRVAGRRDRMRNHHGRNVRGVALGGRCRK